MGIKREDLLLYAVTDRHWLRGGQTLCQQVAAALDGGVTCVQLREKQLDAADLLEEARAIQALCRARGVPFLIDDDVELAIQLDADGVHVGQRDMDARAARMLLGPHKILGVSARTVAQAEAAARAGADYLGVGAMFATDSKSDAVQVDHAVVREICRAVDIPAIGIGGITAENIGQLAGNGLAGVAVISAIFGAPQIRTAAQTLRRAAEEMVKTTCR